MKILVLAPHPFYQERGTPIAVDLLIRALSECGHHVDVLTFHEGSQRVYDRVRLYRINPLFNIHGIRPGFSLKKVYCDIFLMFKFISFLFRNKYDVVHAIEEGAFMALAVSPLSSTPFICDMDSSMTTQVIDQFPILKLFEGMMRYLESLPMRYARAVVPMCDALADEARKYRDDNICVLKDVSLLGEVGDDVKVPVLRDEMNINGKIAMYIGNLEAYQGIDLLLESFALVRQTHDDVTLVIVGGEDTAIERYRHLSSELGVSDAVRFLGKRPVAHIGQYMSQADILVSPRTQGVNTPMKIYSYLHSGTAVLATDLPTHTQVMNSQISHLAAPDKQSFATAMRELLDDDALRARLAAQAQTYIEQEHSYPVFKDRLRRLYASLDEQQPNNQKDDRA